MANASVEVPVDRARLRETVVLLYRATAEALHHALGQAGWGGEEVRRHRARLAELDALLGQLDARGSRGGPVELSAPTGLLRDVLYGALIDAGERLAVACERSWRGAPDADTVNSAASEVIALDALLRRLERS